MAWFSPPFCQQGAKAASLDSTACRAHPLLFPSHPTAFIQQKIKTISVAKAHLADVGKCRQLRIRCACPLNPRAGRCAHLLCNPCKRGAPKCSCHPVKPRQHPVCGLCAAPSPPCP